MTSGQYTTTPAPQPPSSVAGHGNLANGPSNSSAMGAGAGSDTLTAAGPGLLGAPRKLAGRRRRETVAVLLFSGAPIFESSIPLSVFGVDRQDAGVPRYRLLVCAGEEGPLTTTGGLTLTAPYGLEALSRAGTIVVPAWRSISQPPPVEAIAALRKAHHEGARIIGLCTGAFVLAAAGLLDGRPATTHWMYAPTLAKRYPRVHVDPRELFVDDGDVLTSAGTAAGIDLCLHVVRSDHGAEAANALARRLVVPNRRGGGGQAQYIDQSLPEEIGNDPLAEVVTWALENLNQQFDVEVLAARAYMSRRTFDRRFRTLTGSAPLQWLITQRVLQAQRLLETSDLSVDDVARRCGFRSPVALRGHFRRQLGVSPAAYRTTFRARRPAVGNSAMPSPGVPAERIAGAPGGPATGQGGHGQQAQGPSGNVGVTHGQTAANGPGASGAAGRPRQRPLVPPQAGPPAGAFGSRVPERPGDPRYGVRPTGGGAGAAQPGHPGGVPNGQSGVPYPSAHQGPPPAHAHAQPSPGQPVRPSAVYPGGRGSTPADRPDRANGPERADRPVEHAIAEDPDSQQPSARGRQSVRPETEPERRARGTADFGPDGARAVSGARDRAVG
ncbi:AraC family transcriptional regulator [Kitasatospora sp. CB02891]|nr:AraC family transcriptional regulator [Kitasatospora sp. CB02891]